MEKLMEVRANCTITFCSEEDAILSFDSIVNWSKKNNSSNTIVKQLNHVISTIQCCVLSSTKKELVQQINKLLSLSKKCKGCCSFKALIEIKPEIIFWTEHEDENCSNNGENLLKKIIKFI